MFFAFEKFKKTKQEANGPHHSSKKLFLSINTFAQSNDYAITLREKKSLSEI